MGDTNIALRWVAADFGPKSPPGPPFTIIEAYLRNSSTPENAATELVLLLNDGTCLGAPYESPLRVDCYIESIFGESMHIATQLPWDHIWHERLAALIKALGKKDAPPKEVCDKMRSYCSSGEFKWSNFPTFGVQQGESFDYRSRFTANASDVARLDWWSPKEWLSMNAFLATLVAEEFGSLAKSFAKSGFWVLTNTLEIQRDVIALEENVPSAAVWILKAGKWLREHRGLELSLGLPIGVTSDFKGPNMLSDERWKFWADRFKKLTARNDLSLETRDWASRAADFMAEKE
jgi:hypothetical protein